MGNFGSSRGLVHSAEADGTPIVNVTTEQSLSAAKLFAARSFHEGEVIRATLMANYGSTGTPNLTFRGRLAGVEMITTGLLAAGGTGGRIKLLWEFTVRSTGLTGSIISSLETVSNIAALNTLTVGIVPVTVDQLVSQDLDFSVQWDTLDALNTITAFQFFIEFLKSK